MALTKVSTAVVDMSGNTGALEIAKGTTAERDAISSPTLGLLRSNTTDHTMEVYTDNSGTPGWQALKEGGSAIVPPLTVEYLVVAGGGAGGNGMGAGGGAGGLIHNYGGTALTLTAGNNYTVTIGAGATGVSTNTRVNGSNSVFDTLIAIGGGGGSSLQMQRNSGPTTGADGGSGGGSGASDNGNYSGGAALQPSSSSGGFGNAGGSQNGNGTYYPGAGGGGAGAAGTTVTSYSNGGNGGIGLQIDIDGNNYYWAAGGGGDGYDGGNGGNGGTGGGGGGAVYAQYAGSGGGSAINSGGNGGAGANRRGGNGGANTGSGGGGASWTNTRGGDGGSGIVILRYPNSYQITFTAGASPAFSSSNATVGTDTVTTIIAGSGIITFSLV
jgi:hypothetical protein